MKLLEEGHNYTTVAAELHITASTINFHLQNIYAKLQVHSKAEAVARAFRHQLIQSTNASLRAARHCEPSR
jgi:DNA-binding NarL/FixJ family response regulator